MSGGWALRRINDNLKNRYAYIYVSNESFEPVYFDNLQVAHTRGRIIEENHYYAYGFKIAGISSSKLDIGIEGLLKNNYLYNDKEIWDEGDLNWEDYGFRNYDVQTGRFVQIDPLTDNYPYASGYHYAANDPITNIDYMGLAFIPCPNASAFSIFIDNLVPAIANASSSINGLTTGLAIGSAVGQIAGTLADQGNVGNQRKAGAAKSNEKTGAENNTNTEAGVNNPNSPPIFWEEEGFPDIQYWDEVYAETSPFAIVRHDGRYPNRRFLVFHYLGNLGDANERGREAMKANRGNLADKIKSKNLIDRHEVPYKSTMEGGGAAMTFPASASQNQAHGSALNSFYRRNNFKGGEEFWVPLPNKPNLKKPAPVIVPAPNPKFKIPPEFLLPPKPNTPQLTPKDIILPGILIPIIVDYVLTYWWLILI